MVERFAATITDVERTITGSLSSASGGS
jgi:hypothetical protein